MWVASQPVWANSIFTQKSRSSFSARTGPPEGKHYGTQIGPVVRHVTRHDDLLWREVVPTAWLGGARHVQHAVMSRDHVVARAHDRTLLATTWTLRKSGTSCSVNGLRQYNLWTMVRKTTCATT